MHSSILISSKNESFIEHTIQKLVSEFRIDPFDITILEKKQELTKSSKSVSKSIGIEDIRKFQEKLFLTPLKSETKAMIIKNSELLTTEAQNALLKVLEEPPQHTIIILATNNYRQLLPTILSRCIIQEGYSENAKTISEEERDFTFPTDIAGQLKQAQDISKNKEEALQWLENRILILRQQLIKDPYTSDIQTIIQQIKGFQNAYFLVKTTNVNLRLAIENLFLSI